MDEFLLLFFGVGILVCRIMWLLRLAFDIRAFIYNFLFEFVSLCMFTSYSTPRTFIIFNSIRVTCLLKSVSVYSFISSTDDVGVL